MKSRRTLSILALAAAALMPARQPAHAGACPATGTCACTVGTGAVTCLLAKSTGYRIITIDNESTTATIACTDDGTTTPAINTAGSWTIPPGATRQWPAGENVTHGGPISCIASGATTPVTVKGQ